jgi:hypothetical protein
MMEQNKHSMNVREETKSGLEMSLFDQGEFNFNEDKEEDIYQNQNNYIANLDKALSQIKKAYESRDFEKMIKIANTNGISLEEYGFITEEDININFEKTYQPQQVRNFLEKYLFETYKLMEDNSYLSKKTLIKYSKQIIDIAREHDVSKSQMMNIFGRSIPEKTEKIRSKNLYMILKAMQNKALLYCSDYGLNNIVVDSKKQSKDFYEQYK